MILQTYDTIIRGTTVVVCRRAGRGIAVYGPSTLDAGQGAEAPTIVLPTPTGDSEGKHNIDATLIPTIGHWIPRSRYDMYW